MTPYPVYANLDPEFSELRRAAAVVVPVPYDGTSTWIKGADRGPRALLEASTHMERYDIETDSEVWRRGIATDRPVTEKRTPEAMVQAVRRRVEGHLLRKRFVVVIGGEHSVSVGSVQAHAHAHDDLTVLQLDAHADLQPEYRGSRHNHACVMARVREVCPIVQVGIRSMDAAEKPFVDPPRMFFADTVCANGNHGAWMKRAIEPLTRNVYITVDLDVFDPSVLPATGTPEPGGMHWYPLLQFLRRVSEQRNVVGFDVVELCPQEGHRASEFLAAKLIYKLLSYRFLHA